MTWKQIRFMIIAVGLVALYALGFLTRWALERRTENLVDETFPPPPPDRTEEYARVLSTTRDLAKVKMSEGHPIDAALTVRNMLTAWREEK